MYNKQQQKNKVRIIQLTDILRNKHLCMTGIIVGKKMMMSNITMGSATKLTVEWFNPTPITGKRNDYFPAFLELSARTDKN